VLSLSISGVRQSLQDPGYSTASGAINALVYREIGQATLVGSLGYSHLEADKRLFLFPLRRVDDRHNMSISGTFRQFTYMGFAPLLRLSYERNHSTVGIYDYSRVASEIGITRAF
jgi:hypothetical protein